MPSKKLIAPDTSEAPESNSVIAVARALRLLEAFGQENKQLTLAELSRSTALHKTTVLRLARTLAAANYLVQQADGSWRLGRAAGWLGACYQATFNVQEHVEPVLRELVAQSGESASFYVREGDSRICLVRVQSPQAVRHYIRVGTVMPLNLGAPGRVILAFAGQPGAPYDAIRRRGYHWSLGERDPQVSSISAPVFGLQRQVLGSICISGPINRLGEKRLLQLATLMVNTAQQISQSMTGNMTAAPKAMAASTWHP